MGECPMEQPATTEEGGEPFGEIQVELQEFMGSDLWIARSAWTSSNNRIRRIAKSETDADKLVRRLAAEGHATPFERVVCAWWIRMPIMIDRQWMTHRIASHNGLSGRYRTLPEDWYRLPPDVRAILDRVEPAGWDDKGGFGSAIADEFDAQMRQQNGWYRRVLNTCKQAEAQMRIDNDEYKRVREVIRGVIGTASMTERSSQFNLRSMANLFRLRLKPNAQREFRIVSEKMLAALKEKQVAPVAVAALEEAGWQL